MYKVNKERFRAAHERIEKAENAIRILPRSLRIHRQKLLTLCLIFAINAALPKCCLVATYGDTVNLVAGSGFTAPTLEPGPVGTPGELGYDAKAIARWDVVPYQVFSSTCLLYTSPSPRDRS